MRSLITGAGGLIGPHLAEHLLVRGDQVWGTYHSSAESLQALEGRIQVLPCDVRDAAAVCAAIQASRPDRVFHLAAQSRPLSSWQDPAATFQANLLGTLHLLEAVRRDSPGALVVFFGSSAEYEPSPDGPLGETSALHPDSPYGVSKVAAEFLADVYRRAYGMKVVCVRPFFIIGPGHGHNVFARFAQRIVAAENRLADTVEAGRHSALRDLVDVRDAVAAIRLVADCGVPGEVYNLCSGQAVDILEALGAMAKLSARPLGLRFEAEAGRPLDAPTLVGDNTRLRALGWRPRMALEKTLADILDFWRTEYHRRLSAEGCVSDC